jgi:ATP-binding cassette subfamily F protein uup
MIGELADLNNRTRTATAKIDFSASNRQSKQLIGLDGVTYTIGGRTLFRNINFMLQSGMRVGLVGPNGSGKTTLLRLLRGDILPTAGKIQRADSLRIVYFDQNRQLDPEVSLRRALAPDSDSVIYQERVIHVAAWAARFLFSGEDLSRPVGRLSGGERARVLIAQLMLHQADVLLLDEPTNDLDIPTLEILEESLLEYRGALVLVTHDRYMLDRVSTIVLGLDGRGDAERFADYSQWDAWLRSQQAKPSADAKATTTRQGRDSAPADTNRPGAKAKKLSHTEGREFASIEKRIAKAEQELLTRRAALENPEISSDAPRLHTAYGEMEFAQKTVDELYARWAELSQKTPEQLKK